MSISFIIVSIAIDDSRKKRTKADLNNTVLSLLEISIFYMVFYVLFDDFFIDEEKMNEYFIQTYRSSSHTGMMAALITTYVILLGYCWYRHKKTPSP
jgi:hypothetical protein